MMKVYERDLRWLVVRTVKSLKDLLAIGIGEFAGACLDMYMLLAL